METEKVVIYTDGSATPNPGKGGWAALLTMGEYRKLVKGNSGDEKMTNNQAELMAMIVALEALKRPCEVDIISDSQYAVNVASGEWSAKSNFDFIDRLHAEMLKHTVTLYWKREFSTPQQTIVHNMAERESGGIR
jgi:ribonuclease HI